MAEEKEGAPAWMVSFGDMMTLILTFFILLVSMSKEQQQGLVAKGIGSFLVSTRSFGMPGLLDDDEQAAIFKGVRKKFNLPPEEDPGRRIDHVDASNMELVRASLARSLAPHEELGQPSVATFEPGSGELGRGARRYLDLLAPTLRPGIGQVLLLEGHADGSGTEKDRILAFQRSRRVADYLIEEHGYQPERVIARAWLKETQSPRTGARGVDARLIMPGHQEE